MFQNSNSKNMSNGTGSSPSINMISEGTKLKGDINTQNDIRIAGQVIGEVTSKGKLIITSTGRIEGNARSADADIAGRLEGDLHVTNKLMLRQSAKIDGKIHTKSVLVEEGAQINASFKMGESGSVSGTADSEFADATRLKSEEKK
ncbi:MAG: polymer-forming cytoskeletal protein [Balneolaceae bacterium]